MDPGGVRHEDVARAKTALRRDLLAARRALDDTAIVTARAAVARHVLANWPLPWSGDVVVAAYEPLRTEPGSPQLLAALHARASRLLVPVTLPDRDLSWRTWTPSGAGPDLGRDAVGDAAVVLVPACAVGRDGGRLGRGGGSYDRALRRTRALRVALLHRDELLDSVPVDDHDAPVDATVTPDGWTWVGTRTEGGAAR